MTFHEFGPWRASKIVAARSPFVTANFYCKTLARIKKHLVRAHENIKIVLKRYENKEKLDTRKSSNSIRPMTFQNDEFQVSPKIRKTNIKSTKTNILDPSKHEKY